MSKCNLATFSVSGIENTHRGAVYISYCRSAIYIVKTISHHSSRRHFNAALMKISVYMYNAVSRGRIKSCITGKKI